MAYFINTFLSLCMFLSILGTALWLMYIFASAVMIVYPYALAVIAGSLVIAAFIAWRRNRGH